MERVFCVVLLCLLVCVRAWAGNEGVDDSLSPSFLQSDAEASTFVPKKGVIPRDFSVELVLPKKNHGSESKAKSSELKQLVRKFYRPLGQHDKGPYLGKCTVELREWSLGDVITATFRVECWSVHQKGKRESKAWFHHFDTPVEVMNYVAQVAAEHEERMRPTPKEPVGLPEDLLEPEWDVVT